MMFFLEYGDLKPLDFCFGALTNNRKSFHIFLNKIQQCNSFIYNYEDKQQKKY